MTPSNDRFDVLARALADAGSPIGAAELHGSLCGVLCAAGPRAGAQWLGRCVEEWTSTDAAREECVRLLAGLCNDTWLALSGSELQFMPLLPDEDEALAERVHALASWCNGFVSGLGLGGLELVNGGDGADLREIVHDFVEIGKAGFDEADAETESAETSITEITEFVRVGVQIVFEATASAARGDGAPPDRPTVH